MFTTSHGKRLWRTETMWKGSHVPFHFTCKQAGDKELW